MKIPYERLEWVFLDAGNTLISMDFDWIARELGALGVSVDATRLRRAEAAARPVASQRSLADEGDGFGIYLREVLANLSQRPRDIDGLVEQLVPRLKRPGEDYRLWSWLMPGVEEALAALVGLDLRLAVVSNSDGSVERALDGLGLSRHLEAVFDSDIVGYAKPDPRIFAHALRHLGARADRTVHVGDMYFQDVAGSREAGLHSLLLDPYDDWHVADCERCPDLSELAVRIRAARG